jgi:hypothetical protein
VAAEAAAATQAGGDNAIAGSSAAAGGITAAGSSAAAGGGGAARKKRRVSGFLQQTTGASQPQPVPQQHEEMRPYVRFTAVALQEIGSFRKLPVMPMYDESNNANNPLLWWKTHASQFPQLAKLARRVLCVPATSAPSERIFSIAGLIARQKRNRLAPETVALLVHLRNAWPPAAAWRKVHPEKPEED